MKVKGKFIPLHNIQAYRWSGCTLTASQQQMEVNGELKTDRFMSGAKAAGPLGGGGGWLFAIDGLVNFRRKALPLPLIEPWFV